MRRALPNEKKAAKGEILGIYYILYRRLESDPILSYVVAAHGAFNHLEDENETCT